ncbi:putative myb-like protein J-like [Capsicum annuum]|nr:putative myb-like protein J-like [Capsicum annuum]
MGVLVSVVTGKELWGYIDGADPAPTDPTKLGEWKIKDARVMTWLLGSIDPLIISNLRPNKIAKVMWDYLQKVYNQDNSDRCFHLEELLYEEQRYVTQNAFRRGNDVDVTFTAQGKGMSRDMNRTQCYNCKEYVHITRNYGKKFCNYCKQQGHIIKECPTRPQNNKVNYFHASINGSTLENSSLGPSGQVLTPEMDQVSGTIIAKGPKVGRLFPIQFSVPPVISFVCTSTANKTELCLQRLRYPNSIVLSHLSNSGLLGSKNQFSPASFDFSTCKLGKSKILPFPNLGSRATKCFYVVHSDVWGISPIVSYAQFKYFVTFIDDYS